MDLSLLLAKETKERSNTSLLVNDSCVKADTSYTSEDTDKEKYSRLEKGSWKRWTELLASHMNQETVNSVIFIVLSLPIPPSMVPLIFGTMWRKNTQRSVNGLPNKEL